MIHKTFGTIIISPYHTMMGMDGDTISKNRYVYVKNNPLRYTDPTGNEEAGVHAATFADSANNALKFLYEMAKRYQDIKARFLEISPVSGDVSDIYALYLNRTLFTDEPISEEERQWILLFAMMEGATSGQARIADEAIEAIDDLLKKHGTTAQDVATTAKQIVEKVFKKGIKVNSYTGSSRLLKARPIKKVDTTLKEHIDSTHVNQSPKWDPHSPSVEDPKSYFSEDLTLDDIKGLIEQGGNYKAVKQPRGNYEIILKADRVIGTEVNRRTGIISPTDVYTVIIDKNRNLVTAFPGLPPHMQ